jgi:uncharacterized protein (TIGR03382 family)
MLLRMRRFVTILASLLVAAPAVAGTLNSPILGGTPATLGQYPSVVLVEVGGGLCTGTLVTKDWVLTAAHCVSPAEVGLPNQAAVTASVKVHFNTVNAAQSAGTVVLAADTIPDPMFNVANLGSYDSGLIKLKTPVTDITPVPVNFDAALAPVGIMVTMVGFGATAQGGGGSIGVEYVVTQTSVSCSGNAGLDKDLLCFNQTNGKGKCQGDSGGPSFAMVGGKLLEVGITSFGDNSCSQFGADTRTDAERAFILQHVPELECQTDADCPMMKECFQRKCIVTPFQPTGLGTTCTTNAECDSATCAITDQGGKCSMGCTVGMAATTCPAGFDCLAAGAAGTCWPTATDGGGCCDASGAGAPTMLACIGLIGLVLRRRRR